MQWQRKHKKAVYIYFQCDPLKKSPGKGDARKQFRHTKVSKKKFDNKLYEYNNSSNRNYISDNRDKDSKNSNNN